MLASSAILLAIFSKSFANHDFDFMLFAQVWPASGCIEWEDRSDDNTCIIRDSNSWTVHGIWPTKDGKIGPLFCNRTARFDEHELDPIMDRLRVHWTNVRANTVEDSFWEHEWTKHGTCAMQLGTLDTELKYFSKGLEWNQKYPVGKFLASQGITPGGSYSAEAVYEAVRLNTGKNPALECDKLHDFDLPALAQISICFDKNLEVIDCDHAKGGHYGRCPPKGRLAYPKDPSAHMNYAGVICGIIFGTLIISLVVFYLVRKHRTRLSYSRI